ncbi:LuxR family transcriptional regulator [Sedimentitalea sp. JM2-8]|uniref:LuxR family transcriptional regulator n=1 Tax=Sedimentitalea xiamensis TaxID=3050037 RepID=A0ABT7FCT3_9RHOB|nr:LuxR family transcriptional regulator [Sedimentitalea xiamensis]MDK3072919.1 LuxR family transcriptional regulator [Sedimentitalea xiamensis]
MKLIDLSSVQNVHQHAGSYLDELCQLLEFDYASYATINPVSGDVQGYANYPDAWKLHYAKQSYHNLDPTLTQSAKSIAPVDWGCFEQNTKFTKVFKDAHDFGISDRGLTVPVRGPYGDCGLLSVTRDCSPVEWEKLKKSVIGDLQASAVHMHDNVTKTGVLARAISMPALSSREVEILQWVAAGKSQQDIGDILSISHRTVEVHLRSGREKLGALSTPQAVGRAIGLNLIMPG